MQITGFKDMYFAELHELVSMEGQLADLLQRTSGPLLERRAAREQAASSHSRGMKCPG